ncbi:MAG: 2,3-bisphosphoglycerate-independent phosphoglycerate mutase [Spirochaetaceae bacterium]|nr:2,3-bisphosphoglycerate-independent phosphoglycerate mutase [Spirochaetaceae bacterium]MCF7949954.1 2,3-bisphosphoglycerate-independent phosphoglycerate mutase [Spirochaetia bacterium]MCF7952087.1 2,3-bisphosphoglycerate-independent phosphoglycerate mutase [Spirochaetaceae bacterium]
MGEPLKKKTNFTPRRGPVVLAIMDGVGIGKYKEGDGAAEARTETLDELKENWPTTSLKAHGTAVGLPDDGDMGNSEVGHNAIGCGRVYAQGAKRVNQAIKDGSIFDGEVWNKLVAKVKETKGSMHFLGLMSDGNVHSNLDHLKALVSRAKQEGVSRVRIHGLLDGRDVGETSALEYFDPFEEFLQELSDDSFDARIASGGGRMQITMDRYNANWDMVKRGWETHVLGEGRSFSSAHEAIETLRKETEAIDQDLPPFVIVGEDGQPVGTVEDGDSFILFNFRGDRALEITQAFEAGDEFDRFDRQRMPKVEYAGIMEYDGDLHIPKQFLVPPPSIERTMAEYLVNSGVRQYSVSETQKFGHVTYFFNGNRSGKFSDKLETYEEVKSDNVPFEQRPWMKAAEVTDKVIEAINSGEYEFIKFNYPNGDMVGHTGIYEAVLCAMSALDLSLTRIKTAVEKAGGVMVVSADHGNSDDMYARDKSGNIKIKANGKPEAKTSHSLNPVPCIVYDPQFKGEYSKTLRSGLGISSLAGTCIELLGYQPPEDYDPSVLEWK